MRRTTWIGRWAAAVTLLALLASASGCFRVHYVDPSKQPTGRSYSQSLNYLALGFGQVHGEIKDQCGSAGVAKVSSSTGVFGVVVGILTVGLWQHRTFEVTCAGGAQ